MEDLRTHYNKVLYIHKELLEGNETAKFKNVDEFNKRLHERFSKDAEYLIERFKEIGVNIDVRAITNSMLSSFKECIYTYVNGQFISTITTVGITAELFCVLIFEFFLINKEIEDQSINRRIKKFMNISQSERIDILESVVGYDEKSCSILHEIRKIRNKNVHPHKNKDYKKDALASLKKLIVVLHEYSNLLEED